MAYAVKRQRAVYYKIAVDDSRDRIIVRCTGNVHGKMIGGRRVGKDGCNIGNEFVLFSPEDIKYEMVMNNHYCILERRED